MTHRTTGTCDRHPQTDASSASSASESTRESIVSEAAVLENENTEFENTGRIVKKAAAADNTHSGHRARHRASRAHRTTSADRTTRAGGNATVSFFAARPLVCIASSALVAVLALGGMKASYADSRTMTPTLLGASISTSVDASAGTARSEVSRGTQRLAIPSDTAAQTLTEGGSWASGENPDALDIVIPMSQDETACRQNLAALLSDAQTVYDSSAGVIGDDQRQPLKDAIDSATPLLTDDSTRVDGYNAAIANVQSKKQEVSDAVDAAKKAAEERAAAAKAAADATSGSFGITTAVSVSEDAAWAPMISVNHATGDTGSNPYAYGQCTWWAWLRRHQMGLPCSSFFGNAMLWGTQAAALGYQVDSTPAVGAVIVFQPHQSGASDIGHVGVVEAVDDATGTFTISEANVDGNPHPQGRTLKNDGQYTFIHN